MSSRRISKIQVRSVFRHIVFDVYTYSNTLVIDVATNALKSNFDIKAESPGDTRVSVLVVATYGYIPGTMSK